MSEKYVATETRAFRAGIAAISSKIALALAICVGVTSTRPLYAEEASGPAQNPFRCQGTAEMLGADRTIAQVREELVKAVTPPYSQEDPPTVRAIKLCVVAELKRRVGDADASDYYDLAIRQQPDEPAFEFFAGRYYAGSRGAGGPVIELAEQHYYRALEKLSRLQTLGRLRDYHRVVRDYVRKGLLVLYQQDGMPLLPWKAYPQHADGRLAPGLSVATQLTVSEDTRDGLGANETSGFVAEAGLYETRRALPATRLELYEIARSPLRVHSETELRLRQAYFGALDFRYGVLEAKDAAVGGTLGFGHPELKNDINVREMGLAYERVLPLYPLFDLKLKGGVKRVHRVGVVEAQPGCAQDFNAYEASPVLSRFVSSDKLTIGGTYVFMDIPNLDCPGVDPNSYLSVRGRAISAVNVEYAFYSPLLLPALKLASLRPERTSTRGFYLSAGYVNDNEVFGDHRIVNETLYAGSRLEGPGPFDVGLTESLYVSRGTIVNSAGGETPNAGLSGKMLRSSFTLTRRLLNPDATPGVPRGFGPFAGHALNWVFPLSFDRALVGRNAFDNVRIGTELWWQMFGTGFWGPSFLFSANYQYQYFYRFDKHVHNVGLSLRLGFREL